MQQKALLQSNSKTLDKKKKKKQIFWRISYFLKVFFFDLLTNLFFASMPFTSNLFLLRPTYLPHHFSAYQILQFMLFWQLSWKWNDDGIMMFTTVAKIILHANSLGSKACKHVLIKSMKSELLNQFIVT